MALLIEPQSVAADDSAGAAVSASAKLAANAIQVPEGFHIAPVASEPKFANPVAFCFDPKGRIFVAETHRVHKGVEDNRHHMDWLDDDLAARTVADRRAYTVRRMGDQIHRFTEASDQVRLLEDRDDDGLYESSSIFSGGYNAVEDGAAAGVLWVDDRLLLTCIPALYELRDADGDGRAEDRRILATGFGVHFAFFGHDLHGLCEGPDGKIYFSVGDRGLHVETPHGLLSNPDSGAVLRCRRDGSDLEIVATGLRNPQELAFNEYGDLFTVDNNSDSGDRARLVHVVEGMDAGWRMTFQYLPDRGPFNRERIWHTQNDEQPASMVPPLIHLSDGPSGLVRYPGTGLPAAYDGAFFLCDFRGQSGISGVRKFWVEPHGATYRLTKDEMFVEGVLATDCEFGPDGAFYISDWVDGWSGTGMGRIHRVECDDPESAEQRLALIELLPKISELPPNELVELLRHANQRVRMSAQQKLVAAGPSVLPSLVEFAGAAQSQLVARLHAIWAIGELAESEPQWFDRLAGLCGDVETEVRAQTAKTLGLSSAVSGDQRAAIGKALTKLLADPSPRVRCFAAISLGKLQYEPSRDALLQLADEYGDSDPVLRHAAAVGLAGTQTADALVAAGRDATESERLTLVVALGRQKSPLVAPFLRDRAERVRLEAARLIWDTPLPEAYDDLAKTIDSHSASSEPMLRRVLAANVAVGTPAHLKRIIHCGLRAELSAAMSEHVWELVRNWRSPSPRDPVLGSWRPISARPAEQVITEVKAALPEILRVSDNRPHGLIVAAELGIREAYPPLMKVVEDNAHPDELRSRGLSALANADERTVARAIDSGLRSQQAALRSAARQIMVQRFPERAVEVLRETVAAGTVRERQAAIDMLAGLDVPAAREVIGKWMDRVESGSCPPELQLEVLEAAGKMSDPALVERQQKYVANVSGEKATVAFSACLEGGDPARGERIFEESSALSCRRCHAVAPGQQLIGPSLSDVGLRRSREELLESIVSPNEKISEGFQTIVLLLDTGKVVSGVVRHEDEAQAVLIDAEGKENVVDLNSVEDRYEGQSAMPEDLVKQMSQRELRDLVEYLSTLRTPNTVGAAAAPANSHRRSGVNASSGE